MVMQCVALHCIKLSGDVVFDAYTTMLRGGKDKEKYIAARNFRFSRTCGLCYVAVV